MSFPRYPKYRDSGVEWLGQVPQHWDVKRLQRCVDVAEGQVDPEDARYSGMSLIAPNHIESGTGRLLKLETADEQAAESGKYECQAGDVVYSKIRPALRKVCIAPEDCLCSADMYPLRSHSGLVNPFLFWLMLSEQISALTVLESQRVAMPKINRESLKSVMLAVPPGTEQTAISSFLVRETSKIDALVAEQRLLIDLLKEKRQAVISHAVTKGLNPHTPMKPSGIEWLGDVPAHWSVRRLKFLCDVQTGDRDTENAVEDGRYPFFVRSQTVERINSMAFDCEAILTAGDGVGVGKVFHYHKGPFDFHQRVYMMNNFREVSGPFLFHFLRENFYKVALEGGAKSTVDSLRRPVFMNFTVCVPSTAEQAAIVTTVKQYASDCDALTAQAQRVMDLLQERRTALISAAVTGQIDVRGMVAPQTTATS